MGTPIVIYLVRHGQTVWNRADRRQGQRDSPLTMRGINQARAVGHLLNDLLGEAVLPIVSSPLGRAWQTAVIIAEVRGVATGEITHDQRLAEVSYGRWEGLTTTQIRETDPEVWKHRQTDRWSIPAPGGESNADLQQRVGAWHSERDRTKDIIVVGHGALNRALVGLVAGLKPDQALALPEDQESIFRLSEGFYDIVSATGDER